MASGGFLGSLRRLSARFIGAQEAWALRYINADANDTRLKRLHLDSPGHTLKNRTIFGSTDPMQHEATNTFISRRERAAQRGSGDWHRQNRTQARRLRALQNDMSTSANLADLRLRAKRTRFVAWAYAGLSTVATVTGGALLPFAPPAGAALIAEGAVIGALGVKFAHSYKKAQKKRREARYQLGERLLNLKRDETTAFAMNIGQTHRAGVSFKRLPSTGRNTCRLSVEFFDGWSEASQRRTISLPQSALRSPEGMKALEDFLASAKKRGPKTEVFGRKLDRFLKSTGGRIVKMRNNGNQVEQMMGNCLVHNPHQALFRAIERDPNLGPNVSRAYQQTLKLKAHRIIRNSSTFRAAEKDALIETDSNPVSAVHRYPQPQLPEPISAAQPYQPRPYPVPRPNHRRVRFDPQVRSGR